MSSSDIDVDDEENVGFIHFLLSLIFPIVVSVACSLLALRDSMHKWPKNFVQELPRVLKWASIVVFVCLVDNYLTWLVSYFYVDRKKYLPLQDNAMILNNEYVRFLHELFPGKYLVIICIFCVSNYRKSITNIGFRVFYTISVTRIIRIIAYSLTVLPSRKKNCFKVRMEGDGFLDSFAPRMGGGCNDLVISGHANILGLEVSLIREFGGSNILTFFAFFAATLDSLNDVFTKQHYSVDMFLGILIGILIYERSCYLYPTVENEVEKEKVDDEPLPHSHGKELHWLHRIPSIPRKRVFMIVSCCWIFFFDLSFTSLILSLLQGTIYMYYTDDKFTLIKHVVVCCISSAMSIF